MRTPIVAGRRVLDRRNVRRAGRYQASHAQATGVALIVTGAKGGTGAIGRRGAFGG
jgi:hypothetical protein